MKPSCTDCWKLILGRNNSFFSPHEESWIQTSLATSSCHGKTKQISAPDTCVYSVCVQCVCTVCVYSVCAPHHRHGIVQHFGVRLSEKFGVSVPAGAVEEQPSDVHP